MTGPRAHRADESGFSLVEMVVSMVLLTVVAMAFLPLALRATTAAASGTTLATATRLVSKQLELVQAEPQPACEVTGPQPAWQLAGTTTDARGVSLQTWTRFESPCTPAGGPVVYVVSVTRTSDPEASIARGTTLVTVPAW